MVIFLWICDLIDVCKKKFNDILKSVTQIRQRRLIGIICKWNEKDIRTVTGGEQWDVFKSSDVRGMAQYFDKYMQTETENKLPHGILGN